jgi:molecular chaperone DnaK (HSP70)
VTLLIILIINSSKNSNNNSNYKSNDKIIINKNLEKIGKNKIIGLYFGTSNSGYYILENNEKKRTDSFPSELIMDEDSERGLFYGNKAHSYPKNDLAKQKKLYFSNFKRYIDPNNNNNTIKSDFPDNHEVKLETVIIQYLSLLKENNLNYLGDENYNKWILTVPGLWDDKGKQLMKNVSNKIGMKDSEII